MVEYKIYDINNCPIELPCLISIDDELYILRKTSGEKPERFLIYKVKNAASTRRKILHILFDGYFFYLKPARGDELIKIKIYGKVNPKSKIFKMLKANA